MAQVNFPIKNVKVKKGNSITPESLGIFPEVAENNVIDLTIADPNGVIVHEGNNYIRIGKDADYSFSGSIYTKSSSYKNFIDKLVFQDGIDDLGGFADSDNAIYVQREITYPEGYNGDLVKIKMRSDRESDYISGEEPYLWGNYIVKIVVPRSLEVLDLSSVADDWESELSNAVRVSLDPHIYLNADTVDEVPDISFPSHSTYGELYVNESLYNDIKSKFPQGWDYNVHNLVTNEVLSRYVDPGTI